MTVLHCSVTIGESKASVRSALCRALQPSRCMRNEDTVINPVQEEELSPRDAGRPRIELRSELVQPPLFLRLNHTVIGTDPKNQELAQGAIARQSN